MPSFCLFDCYHCFYCWFIITLDYSFDLQNDEKVAIIDNNKKCNSQRKGEKKKKETE